MKKEWKEEQIRDYLLGVLPENDTEELDKLSVTDDEFAFRLKVMENELLDAYLKGEISEDNLNRFKSRYLTYPPRTKKIKVARAFHCLLEKEPRLELRKESPVSQRFPWLAAAAVVLMLTTGYLMFQNIRMRNDMAQERVELKALRARELELRKQLDRRHATNQGEETSGSFIAMNLPPATRGTSKIPLLEIPAGTISAMLILELERNPFYSYHVVLNDPATHRILWISESLKAGKTIQIKVPVNVFKTQHYQFELYGFSTTGGTEFVAGYPISVKWK